MLVENPLNLNEQKTIYQESLFISVIVATYNRSSAIQRLLNSILELDYPDFELIVVDQSEDGKTKQALAGLEDKLKIRYVHSAKKGLSLSRNIGISLARSEFIAITDDDCVVPSNWLNEMSRIFQEQPKVGLIFGQVLPEDFDSCEGFVPAYTFEKSTLFQRPRQKVHARGIGACMGLRKNVWSKIGGFDELLGAGAPLRSCEDGDIALRILLSGSHVIEAPELQVIHHGFRTYYEGKELTKRDWYGIGAAYTKFIRSGEWVGLYCLLYELFSVAGVQAVKETIRYKRPAGLKRMYGLLAGTVGSYKYSINKKDFLYSPELPPEQN